MHCRSLAPEVHEELTKSWKAPSSARTRYTSSSVLTTLNGGAARGYSEVAQVERVIAVHLCPQNSATWRNCSRLPSKACTFTSSHVARAYNATDQAASTLHAMAILQVHQAKVLRDLHEGGPDPEKLQEWQLTMGRAISTLVVQESHLWLNLTGMRDAKKVRFLDAPISQGGLFGDTVKDFAQQFSIVKKQTEASLPLESQQAIHIPDDLNHAAGSLCDRLHSEESGVSIP